jgi:hypothetical protein
LDAVTPLLGLRHASSSLAPTLGIVSSRLVPGVIHASPTRMNLTVTKSRLKGAQTGHSLLAKKRDALTTRFRQILKKVDEVGGAGDAGSTHGHSDC